MESRPKNKEELGIKLRCEQINANRKIIKTTREDQVQATERNRANNPVWDEDGRNKKEQWEKNVTAARQRRKT